MKLENLGRLAASLSVISLQEENEEFKVFVTKCLDRYLKHDWGDLSKEDRVMNDRAVKSDERILASYKFPQDATWNAINHNGEQEYKIWIITEWNRSVTTILFPGEY